MPRPSARSSRTRPPRAIPPNESSQGNASPGTPSSKTVTPTDTAAESLESLYASAIARVILGAASSLAGAGDGSVPRRLLINHLRGNQAPAEASPRDGFGLLESHRGPWVEDAVDRLVEEGLLELAVLPRAGARIRVAPAGEAALRGQGGLPAALLPPTPKLGLHPEVEGRLRELRRRLAASEGVSPFVIFPNGALAALAERMPSTLAELAAVPGMGETRVRKYGRKVLAALRK